MCKNEVQKSKVLSLSFSQPVELLWCGEFVSPEKEWKHLTRVLDDYELFIVTQGILYIADEAGEYTVGEGGYLIMPPTKCQHGTRVSQCRFFWMHFRCQGGAQTVFAAQGRFYDGESVSRIVKRMFAVKAREDGKAYAEYLATALLLELSAQSGGRRAGEADTVQRELCERAKEYVRAREASDVKVRDVAKELGYHEKYLSAVFSREAGMTLKQYIIQRRIERAKELLQDTNYTISEISYFLNFPDPHSFSRFFKNNEGVTAQDFRRAVRHQEE